MNEGPGLGPGLRRVGGHGAVIRVCQALAVGRSTTWSWAAAVAGAISALTLLAPWVRSGRVDKSTVDLLRSAAALEVLGDTGRIAAVAAWYLIPVLAAVAVVAAAWQRPRLTAAAVVPMGPMMVVAFRAVSAAPFDVRWGALSGVVAGLTASGLGALLLIDHARTTDFTRTAERSR